MPNISAHRVKEVTFDLLDHEEGWFDITIKDTRGRSFKVELYMDNEVKTEIIASMKKQLEEAA